MNLYFQCFTQNQSKDALELLRFPSIFVPSLQINGKAKMSTGGKIASFKFGSGSELVEKTAKRKFNELEIRLASVPFDIGLSGLTEATVTGVFYPSTGSDLWFSSTKWPAGGDGSARSRKMNAKARELALTHHKIKQSPCRFEVVYEVATQRAEREVLNGTAETLANRIAHVIGRIEPFGCCDIGGDDFCVRLESNFLTTSHIRVMANVQPPAYPRLGECFDKLHSLMFGKQVMAHGLAEALGQDARLIRGENEGEVAAVVIKPGCDVAAANERASKWLWQEM